MVEWTTGMATPTKCCSVSIMGCQVNDHWPSSDDGALPAVSRSVTQVALQRGTRDKATLKHILRSVPGKKRGWRQPRFSTALIASYPGWPSTLLTWFLV